MKIICVGRNYAQHIAELNNQKPIYPVLFMKADSSLLPKNQPFYIPPFSENIHYEAELVVRINRLGKHIEKKFAHKYYDSIGLGIDFTARDLQDQLKADGLPWEKAKSFDGSCVLGNKWIPIKNVKNQSKIDFCLFQNGKKVQQANTQEMLWSIDELISYISTFFTLKIGDLIFTGTPSGVGKVNPNDKLEGYLEDRKLISLNIK
ncbi:MAG: fumarylacetoacetate hydrolase family protein [Bacteroidota bacterium]